MNRILNGKIESFCRHYNGPRFHAILCDPPYHLTSIVKRFSNGEPSHTKTAHDIANRSTPHARQAAGFMNQRWDGGDVAFRPETWAALAELLYPGAFVFAFAGTRGYHRMAVAMEDAGLVIHPAIGWCFGSGFPKATRIDTQIDNMAGAEREIISKQYRSNGRQFAEGQSGFAKGEVDITKPATLQAKAWQGHRYGLQALKPAFEFIAVAQKPYQGKPVKCIVESGAGALNIEGARIETKDPRPALVGLAIGHGADGHSKFIGDTMQGRWPANLILQHSSDCDSESCAEGCAVRMMDEQSGDTLSTGGGGIKKRGVGSGEIYGEYGQRDCPPDVGKGDSGGASRFFFNADYMLDRLEDSDPIVYQAKAGKSERDAGMGEFVYPESDVRHEGGAQHTKGVSLARNHHPTIKPISLCKYLATLLLPPDSYSPRRILIPFAGSGSEMIGARLAGWESVVGVEMTAEYATIAKARLSWWESKLVDGHSEIDRMLAAWNKESESENESGDYQTSIFDILESK